jgi:hypothetical protein
MKNDFISTKNIPGFDMEENQVVNGMNRGKIRKENKRQIQAVQWLKSLVAGLSPRRPGLTPRSIHVGFMADKMELRQVFLRVLQFSPVNIIPPSLSKLISSGECVIC